MAEERNPLPPPPPPPLGSEHMGTVAVLPTAADIQSAVASTEDGRKIHDDAVRAGLESDVFVATALIEQMWLLGHCISSVLEDVAEGCGCLELHGCRLCSSWAI
ncbi:hypothetical protein EJ110_NYTH13022 [Nymphaea thermarum]|nr:hypothetical protein EJ110_NYTH13022 [Nymphaea thermarum]